MGCKTWKGESMWQVGVLDDVLTNVDNVIRKGRLGPGQTVVADLSSGTFKENTQIAKEVGSKAPYEEWLSSSTRLKDLNASDYTRECLMSSSEVCRLPHVAANTGSSVKLEHAWACTSCMTASAPLHAHLWICIDARSLLHLCATTREHSDFASSGADWKIWHALCRS